MTGETQQKPSWEVCVRTVAGRQDLQPAVGAMYVTQYFSISTKNAADQMVKNLMAEFKKILEEQDWMDPVTRN